MQNKIATFTILILLNWVNPNCLTLHAQERVWTGATNSDWTTASNWSPLGVPLEGDSVIILNQSNQPILSSSTPDLLHVKIETNAVLTLLNGGNLNIDGSPSNSQLIGLLVRGGIIVSGLNDTIIVQNTSSDGVFVGQNEVVFINNGVIITNETTFVGIHFNNTTDTLINNGQFFISNSSNNGLFIDRTNSSTTGTFVNNGSISIDHCPTGLAFRTLNSSTITGMRNFGKIEVGDQVTFSIRGSNDGGSFTNEPCGILSVKTGFGSNISAIRNNGVLNYLAVNFPHTGSYQDSGFQFDPNEQLPNDNSTILSLPYQDQLSDTEIPSPLTSGTIIAEESITFSGLIESGNTVSFISANKIELTENFTVELGAEFLGLLQECINNQSAATILK